MDNDNTDTQVADSKKFTPTPGMAQIQNAVEFTNESVLQPDVKPINATAKMLADQAAAMLIQDARSYLQGNEQILTMATAKALALILSGEIAKGTAAMAAITTLQVALPTFAAAIGTTATAIATEFKG